MTNQALDKIALDLSTSVGELVRQRDRLQRMYDDQSVELAMITSRCKVYEAQLTDVSYLKDKYLTIATRLQAKFSDCVLVMNKALSDGMVQLGSERPNIPEFSEKDQRQLAHLVKSLERINPREG